MTRVKPTLTGFSARCLERDTRDSSRAIRCLHLARVLMMLVLLTLGLALSTVGQAATLIVTSPIQNGTIGRTNTLDFQVTGVSYQTTVTATLTDPNGAQTKSTGNFTPDTNGNIVNSLPINFGQSAPEGQYQIVVDATSPGVSFTPTTIDVQVLIKGPILLDFSPVSGAYVQGIVHIRASVSDSYLASWTVQVAHQDIPNNTGTTSTIAVDWDTSQITNQTSEEIEITAVDLGGNQISQTLTVTIDRTKPVITFIYPQSSVAVIAGSQINVVIDITVPTPAVMTQNGVDVLALNIHSQYLSRVGLTSVSSKDTTTFRWTGRLRQGLRLPRVFMLQASAVDLAGNTAEPATITVMQR